VVKDSVKYVEITLGRIIQDTERLKDNPLLGRIVPEINDEKYRELINGNYRTIYTFDEKRINNSGK
jgi:toxin ParE1/3/4